MEIVKRNYFPNNVLGRLPSSPHLHMKSPGRNISSSNASIIAFSTKASSVGRQNPPNTSGSRRSSYKVSAICHRSCAERWIEFSVDRKSELRWTLVEEKERA